MAGRGSKNHRPHYHRWRQFRAHILQRDGHQCTEPGCNRTWGLHVHHIKELKHGGARFDPDNCRTVCAECHSRIHATPVRADKAAWGRRIDELMR